jgi:predicted nucleotidyltransferase
MKNMISYNLYSSNRRKSKWKNSNNWRTLYESIIPNEVITTLNDWKENVGTDKYLIIGGIALSYYIKPRYTEDLDLIFLSYDDIPDSVYKFRRNRNHSFEHIRTGVEVELLTPEHINKGVEFFEVIFQNSIISDGIKIASPESLIALKLKRFNNRDKSDIIELVKYCKENNIDINLEKYNLERIELDNYDSIDYDDRISENLYMLDNVKNLSRLDNIKYKLGDCEVYITNEKFGEPRLHFTKNIENLVKRFGDFQFSISLSEPFHNGDLRIIESSTEYKNMDMFQSEKKMITNFIKSNIDNLKDDWNKLNKRKI